MLSISENNRLLYMVQNGTFLPIVKGLENLLNFSSITWKNAVLFLVVALKENYYVISFSSQRKEFSIVAPLCDWLAISLKQAHKEFEIWAWEAEIVMLELFCSNSVTGFILAFPSLTIAVNLEFTSTYFASSLLKKGF